MCKLIFLTDDKNHTKHRYHMESQDEVLRYDQDASEPGEIDLILADIHNSDTIDEEALKGFIARTKNATKNQQLEKQLGVNDQPVIPRDRWGDLSIVVTGAESPSYLRGAELGHVRKDESNERGLEVVVEADYYTDFDATLRHELCHVKDIMDGKIDLERKRRSSLVYPYCMYTNSEEKRGIVRDLLALCRLSAASLTAYLKGTSLKKYYDSPEEQRACEAEKKASGCPTRLLGA